MDCQVLIENWRGSGNDKEWSVKLRETERDEDPEVQIGHWNADEVEVERGTEVEVVIEKETEETERGKERKKMNEVGERSVTLTKETKESALGREIVLERSRKTEKVRVK